MTAKALLLPNGKQQFLDANGSPLAGGQVWFYQPGTTILATTWLDSVQGAENTNPVILDSAGSAVIFGDQQYRQVVLDVNGNQIWDELTEAQVSQISSAMLPVVEATSTNQALVLLGGAQATITPTLLATIAALRGLATGTQISPQVYVQGYYINGDGGQGEFWLNSGDQSSADNGGTIIIDASGRRWYRQLAGSPPTIKMFGAKGDGATDDSGKIQSAENWAALAGGLLVFPPGIYMVTPGNLTKKNGVSWEGAGGEASVLKTVPGATYSQDLVYGINIDNIYIIGMAFDWNNASTTGVPGGLDLVTCKNVLVENCSFLNIGIFGLIMDNIQYCWIVNNFFQKTNALPTQNDGILITGAAGGSGSSAISGNILLRTGMDLSGANLYIEDNYIEGWAFGSGITVGPDNYTTGALIVGNVILNGAGTDSNNTVVTGIENWANYSLIADNICNYNAGDGIDNAGLNCTISGNLCLNNGQVTGYPSAGISCRYLNSAQNGSGSVVVGNIMLDTQSAPTQKYGYSDQSASLAYISVVGNYCSGNASGAYNILAGKADFRGPTLWGTGVLSGQVIASGASVTGSVSVPGAMLGDVVTISLAGAWQGLECFGGVTASGTVGFSITNQTGSSVTVVAQNINVRVEKPPGFGNY